MRSRQVHRRPEPRSRGLAKGERGRPRRLRRAIAPALIAAIAIAAHAGSKGGVEDGTAPVSRGVGNPDESADLRERFRSGDIRGYRDTRVGRLAVQLIENGFARPASIEHRFRTGDKFRFQVSSNRDGWLYVLHRSPAGEPQLLWPRLAADDRRRHLDDNRVRAQETALIPSAPGLFMFNDEIGNEYFYVVIRPERQAPALSALASPPPAPRPPDQRPRPQSSGGTANAPGPAERQKIVQFSVRGIGGNAVPRRGVVLLPGGSAGDPNAYFAPHPEDAPGTVVMEFRLRHED